jgi:hypothetical protein
MACDTAAVRLAGVVERSQHARSIVGGQALYQLIRRCAVESRD